MNTFIKQEPVSLGYYSQTSPSYSPPHRPPSPEWSPTAPAYVPTSPEYSGYLESSSFNEESAKKERKRRLDNQSPTISDMQDKMRRIECELVVLKNENESLKKRNKLVLEMQDKLCNERRSLEDENKYLKKQNKLISELHNRSDMSVAILRGNNEDLTEKLDRIKKCIETL